MDVHHVSLSQIPEEKVRRKGREEVNGGENEESDRWDERPSGIGQDKRTGESAVETLIENSPVETELVLVVLCMLNS
jgi:hypothetical protein